MKFLRLTLLGLKEIILLPFTLVMVICTLVGVTFNHMRGIMPFTEGWQYFMEGCKWCIDIYKEFINTGHFN